jgi:hypothetical protein
LLKRSSIFSATTTQSIISTYHRERSVFVGDLDVKEEELEAGGVGAHDLLESILERFSSPSIFLLFFLFSMDAFLVAALVFFYFF